MAGQRGADLECGLLLLLCFPYNHLCRLALIFCPEYRSTYPLFQSIAPLRFHPLFEIRFSIVVLFVATSLFLLPNIT